MCLDMLGVRTIVDFRLCNVDGSGMVIFIPKQS